MSGHNVKIGQQASFEVERAPSKEPVRLMLTFGQPNNETARKMMIEVAPGENVNVRFGTFPLTISREV